MNKPSTIDVAFHRPQSSFGIVKQQFLKNKERLRETAGINEPKGSQRESRACSALQKQRLLVLALVEIKFGVA